MSWRPNATLQVLQRRARLLSAVREFFAARGVLEIETPLLCSSGVTDPALEPLLAQGASVAGQRFLQTSPEYAMKRVLAAFGEPIFQIGKAFRDGEAGARHNPEFSLLEWYRPGFDHHQLMAEVAELVAHCSGPRVLHTISYRELFLRELGLDPMLVESAALLACAREHVDVGDLSGDRDLWLDLLMSHVIEPRLAGRGLCFVYDYPASQAALARIVRAGDVAVGQRFELYADGLEIANGYCELADAAEQRRRFEVDNALRRERGQAQRPLDEKLLAALEHGLPA